MACFRFLGFGLPTCTESFCKNDKFALLLQIGAIQYLPKMFVRPTYLKLRTIYSDNNMRDYKFRS